MRKLFIILSFFFSITAFAQQYGINPDATVFDYTSLKDALHFSHLDNARVRVLGVGEFTQKSRILYPADGWLNLAMDDSLNVLVRDISAGAFITGKWNTAGDSTGTFAYLNQLASQLKKPFVYYGKQVGIYFPNTSNGPFGFQYNNNKWQYRNLNGDWTDIGGTDTANMVKFRGFLPNLDTLNLLGGIYTYTPSSTGTNPRADGTGSGTLYFFTTGTARDWKGKTGATMFAVGKGDGRIYSRGYNGSSWSDWRNYDSLLQLHGDIGNFDTTGIVGGEYVYNPGTRGTRPAGATYGAVFTLTYSGDLIFTGGQGAVQVAMDRSGVISSRGFNGGNGLWGGWVSNLLDTSRIIYEKGMMASIDPSFGTLIGDYSYDQNTPGTKPTGSSTGIIQLRTVTGQPVFDGTVGATQFMTDKNGLIAVRGYTVSSHTWSAWSVANFGIDTTNIIYQRVRLSSFDASNILVGDYTYDGTTTATRPAGSTTGVMMLRTVDNSRIFDGTQGATEFVVDRAGLIAARGYTVSSHTWSAWSIAGGGGGGNQTIDTTKIIYQLGTLGNFDGSSIKIGDYNYTGSTTGTHPPSSTVGTVIIRSSAGQQVFDGTAGATMFAIDRNTGNGFVRAYNGTSGTWSSWNALSGGSSGGTTLNGTGYVKQAGATTSYVAKVPNADLVNSSITINGTDVALGGSLNQYPAGTPTVGFTGPGVSSASITGDAGQFELTITTTGAASGTLVNITMPAGWGKVPIVLHSLGNQSATGGNVDMAARATTSTNITCSGAIAQAGTYFIEFMCR